MVRIFFKFIIYSSFDRTLKHEMMKSKIFRKPSLNLNFGQGSYLICGALRDLVPLYNFKNEKNTHGGVLILVKFQASLQLY